MKNIHSHGQLHQDRWVINMFGGRRDGYFLDVGASDGVAINNTYLLEKEYGWSGICFEPGYKFARLEKNREALISDACLYSSSGQTIQFSHAMNNSDYSGIDEHIRASDLDHNEYTTVSKITKTLTECLDQFAAPRVIDYMSLDTEGSEYEILKGLDFDRYQVLAVTVEHNFQQAKRENIKQLLESRGYQRLRKVEYDDWYILPGYFPMRRILAQQIRQFITYLRDGVRNRMLRRLNSD